MSVVVPAYNEEERIPVMLEEAISFLERRYGSNQANVRSKENGLRRRNGVNETIEETGWEIIIVSDGSKDQTVKTALDFARTHAHLLDSTSALASNSSRTDHSTNVSASGIRVVALKENRGKGGAVTHGMRHVRGKYVVFADADGASKFDDLEKMVTKMKELEAKDQDGRAVVVGSRAHLVGSEAVVKVRLLAFTTFSALHTNFIVSAIDAPQRTHVLFSRFHSTTHYCKNITNRRYAMWLQAI